MWGSRLLSLPWAKSKGPDERSEVYWSLLQGSGRARLQSCH